MNNKEAIKKKFIETYVKVYTGQKKSGDPEKEALKAYNSVLDYARRLKRDGYTMRSFMTKLNK